MTPGPGGPLRWNPRTARGGRQPGGGSQLQTGHPRLPRWNLGDVTPPAGDGLPGVRVCPAHGGGTQVGCPGVERKEIFLFARKVLEKMERGSEANPLKTIFFNMRQVGDNCFNCSFVNSQTDLPRSLLCMSMVYQTLSGILKGALKVTLCRATNYVGCKPETAGIALFQDF